jgi:hypothetical protein
MFLWFSLSVATCIMKRGKKRLGSLRQARTRSSWSTSHRVVDVAAAKGADDPQQTRFGQLHNSLNGGSVGHGGMELRLAPPPDADTLVPDAPLDVDLPADDRPDP